jgi:hypothetical protein
MTEEAQKNLMFLKLVGFEPATLYEFELFSPNTKLHWNKPDDFDVPIQYLEVNWAGYRSMKQLTVYEVLEMVTKNG